MFDIKFIRDNPESFDESMALRKVVPCAEEILKLDLNRRKAQTEAQELQTRRNELSKIIGGKKSKGEDTSAELKEVSQSKQAQANAEEIAKIALKDLNKALSVLPNLPASDVPIGSTEDDNVEIKSWGQPPNLELDAKEHFECVMEGSEAQLLDDPEQPACILNFIRAICADQNRLSAQ